MRNFPSFSNRNIHFCAPEFTKMIWSSTQQRTSVQNAFWHWKKHGTEFSELVNSKQYVEKIRDFISNAPSGTLTKTRSNGDMLFYHVESNTLAIFTKEKIPRTLFKPDPSKHNYKTNLDYFNAQ